ncbi:FAD-dependent oxidoreductase [Myxococcota bacterium]|nr:FAD-dependent oxidoreductase [Myxococcota bacterium]
MSLPISHEVLIVGAGPVGLSLALDLARRGVSVRIIDARAEPSPVSRATEVQPRTLEIFEAMGVARALIGEGVKILGLDLRDDGELITSLDTTSADTPFPFLLSLPQARLEAILTAALLGHGVRVERGVSIRWPEADEDSAVAVLTGAAEERARFRYIVGCDGEASTTRAALRLTFKGAAYPQDYVVCDLELDGPTHLDHSRLHVFLSAHGTLTLAPLPGGRWRLLAELPDDAALSPDHPTLQALLDHRAMPGLRAIAEGAVHRYPAARRAVERMRDGRVFLAGDAAHVHSPVGGLGMNLGIEDAFNLGWKLAAVLRHGAHDPLLDSYEAERAPAAQAETRQTHLATVLFQLRLPIARFARDQLLQTLTRSRAMRQQTLETMTELRVSYAGSPLVEEHQKSALWSSIDNDRAVESPTLVDWERFLEGPRAGSRAPDVYLTQGLGERPVWLYELLRDHRVVVLLFDGAAHTVLGGLNLDHIAQALRARFADRVRPILVVPAAARPEELTWDGEVLYDVEQLLHRRYAAQSECVYALRPDTFIGFRAQPADGPKLLAWLERVFGG